LAKAAQTPGVTSLGFVDEARLRWLYENGTGCVGSTTRVGTAWWRSGAVGPGMISVGAYLLSRDIIA